MAFIQDARACACVRTKKEKMLEVADYSGLIEEFFLVKREARKTEQTLGYIEGRSRRRARGRRELQNVE